jgi:hypothetical protein
MKPLFINAITRAMLEQRKTWTLKNYNSKKKAQQAKNIKKWTRKKRLLRKAISNEKASINKINQIRGNNQNPPCRKWSPQNLINLHFPKQQTRKTRKRFQTRRWWQGRRSYHCADMILRRRKRASRRASGLTQKCARALKACTKRKRKWR